ncbi:Dyggve-Melchior-Clausen syndrome protein-domain-containing protein [Sporodiniella umbellata]|nr:Dyggve-Melchior-Clausen syndrome protein-domain-containing protein [Sporodiniella umbellata]
MSSTLLDMHAYTAQRVISLFELLAKRYIKLADKGEVCEDTLVYEDVLMFMLEIIQSILSHRLKQNLQLVYALLLKRELLIPFYSHPRLSEAAHNLDQVIRYFNTRVFEANLKAPSSGEILCLIEEGSRTWSNQKMKSLPHLRFQYEQEPNASEFFVPYVWSLILRKNSIYWNQEKCHVLDHFFVCGQESEPTMTSVINISNTNPPLKT